LQRRPSTLLTHQAHIAHYPVASLPYTQRRSWMKELVLVVMLVPTCREQPLAGHMPNLPWIPSLVRGTCRLKHQNSRAKSQQSPVPSPQPTLLQVTCSKTGLPLLVGTETSTGTTNTPKSGFHSPSGSLSDRPSRGFSTVWLFTTQSEDASFYTAPFCFLTAPAGSGGLLRDRHVCQSYTVSSQPQTNLSMTFH